MKKRRAKRNARRNAGFSEPGFDIDSIFKSNPFPHFSVEQSQGVSTLLGDSEDLLNKYEDFWMNADKKHGLASETSLCPAELLHEYAALQGKYAESLKSFYRRVVGLFKGLEPSRGVKKFVAGYRTLSMVFGGSAKLLRVAADATERIPETKVAFVDAYGIFSSSFSTFRQIHNDLKDEFILFLSRQSDDDLETLCPCEHCKPKPPQQGGAMEH